MDGYVEQLVEKGVVTKLVHHLKRPNSKIVDVVLSILGNLSINPIARKQLKGNVKNLTPIFQLNEESILCRACRLLANLGQDSDINKMLKNLGYLIVLVKTLNEMKTPKAKAAAVRAIRVLGAVEKREQLMTSDAISSVSANLASTDEELLKAVTKCLAKFTSHQCDQFMALQIQGESSQGFQRLVELVKHDNRSIWEPALATLINLSFVESLRPILGNAGVIFTMVIKANDESNKLGQEDFNRLVHALTLYCHESVNRMKLRDAGGLRLFVQILQDDDRGKSIKEKIIKSLKQFAYGKYFPFSDHKLWPVLPDNYLFLVVYSFTPISLNHQPFDTNFPFR